MKRPDVGQAARAYRQFTGDRPARVTVSRLPKRDVAGWKLGPAVGVAYEAVRDGQRERYFHEFKKSARPDLVASADGRKLYFTGGRFKVTERGIEDMPHLFVVNPSSRPSKRRASPMRRRRRHTSTRRRRSSSRRAVALFRANPIRRRRRRHTVVRYARNPIRRRRHSVRRYRRNPSLRRYGAGAVNFGKMLMPAAGIGLGAVGSELIMGYLPIPAQFKSGVARHVTKGAVGVAAGLVLGKLFRQRRLGNYFALGAVAIAVHDAVKELIAARMPNVHLGMYTAPFRGSLGYINPAGTQRLGQYVHPVHGAVASVNAGETNFAC